jgi:hypothetical protein
LIVGCSREDRHGVSPRGELLRQAGDYDGIARELRGVSDAEN